MSTELRLKKLRGSGGYVMATVSDEEQSKGNLGGPDLFLAPMGRLDSAKISKFFCNTCEKDYEGSPKIDYENPNEEVAENLVLVERGQYICTKCGSTIAEYREFSKPDNQIEVGLAKPVGSTTVDSTVQSSGFSQSPSSESLESLYTQTKTPETPEDLPNFDFSQNEQDNSQPQAEMQSLESVSSIVGMVVYDENAKRVGIANEVGVDSSQSLVLVISKDDGTEGKIPWNQIRKVGEIVLLGSQITSPTTEQGKCPDCGFANKQGSKFCEQCGTQI